MSENADGPDRWSHSVGERPYKVTVYERRPGGNLYVRVWDSSARGGEGNWIRRSLKHKDRERAKDYAAEQHAKLRKGEAEIQAGRGTLARLFALYERHRTPKKKSEAERKGDARRIELWTRVLGADQDPEAISRAAWERFTERRYAGEIDARGHPVPETAPCPDCEGENPDDCTRCDGTGEINPRRPVGPRTVERDQRFLLAVLNWGTDWRTEDGYLLSENVCRRFPVEKEKNPSRPVATDARVEGVREVAPELTMDVTWGETREAVPSHLPAIFNLAVETGRRLSAILALRYADLQLDVGPHGAIRWPAETDKQGRESTVPISPRARQALDRHIARMRRLDLPGIGDAPLFPSPYDPGEPVSRHVADRWLRTAEERAELESLDGSLWHAYRRRWATVRKHLPATDVAEAGGWAGPETLQRVYQQADPETMLEVVLGGGELREVQGS